MTLIPEGDLQSPLFSVLLKPRQTIERIVATQPRHRVLLLASLGTVSGLAGQIVGAGAADSLFNWRVLLALVVVGPVLGIVSLYAGALLFNWIGRLLGERASTLELRAVLAWSTTPSIFGITVVVAVLVALHGVAGSNGFSLLLRATVAICGLWSFIVLLLMLSRIQRFGVWRAIVTYVLGLILPL